MTYDDDLGGGPVSALLGDNPGWLGERGSGSGSRVAGGERKDGGIAAFQRVFGPQIEKERAADRQARILDEARKMEGYR